MKIPHLKKKSEIKTCHNISWEDDYSWIHQDDILDVLKDSKKLNPEVRKYLEEENSYTNFHLSDTKTIQKKLFDEIKSRYHDQALPYYSAARLWTDAVIDPTDTRDWISMGIEAANHAPIEKAFNMGVIQV